MPLDRVRAPLGSTYTAHHDQASEPLASLGDGALYAEHLAGWGWEDGKGTLLPHLGWCRRYTLDVAAAVDARAGAGGLPARARSGARHRPSHAPLAVAGRS